MNRAYWDRVAGNYDESVLSVFNHDVAGLVSSRLTAAGTTHPGGTAADLGCGVGKFTPQLARTFAQVHACDLSPRGIAATRRRCEQFPNVHYWELEFGNDVVPFAPVDFALCVNMLIMPSLNARLRAWRAVTNQLAHGGTLLLVVPSSESVQYGYYRALESGLCAGKSCSTSLRESAPAEGSAADLQQGVHRLEGLRTKHYLREELEWMLPAHELDLLELRKLEYHGTPAPCAWDWLAVGRRR